MELNVKILLIVFFNCQGFLHYEFNAGDQTVNQKVYVAILECLQEMLWKKWPGTVLFPTVSNPAWWPCSVVSGSNTAAT